MSEESHPIPIQSPGGSKHSGMSSLSLGPQAAPDSQRNNNDDDEQDQQNDEIQETQPISGPSPTVDFEAQAVPSKGKTGSSKSAGGKGWGKGAGKVKGASGLGKGKSSKLYQTKKKRTTKTGKSRMQTSIEYGKNQSLLFNLSDCLQYLWQYL
jgi:hypothetical protein